MNRDDERLRYVMMVWGVIWDERFDFFSGLKDGVFYLLELGDQFTTFYGEI